MAKKSDLESDRGTASGSREPYSSPGEGRAGENRLHDVNLSDRGESLEDHERDRDSKGVRDGYDDSVAHRRHRDGTDRPGIARGE